MQSSGSSPSAMFVFLACAIFLAGCSQQPDANKPVCHLEDGPCTGRAGNINVSFMITPVPVMSMRNLEFLVELSDGAPVEDATVHLGFSMPGMVMGDTRFSFESLGGGRYLGKGILPRCSKGRKLWSAMVFIARPDGSRNNSEFYLEVCD